MSDIEDLQQVDFTTFIAGVNAKQLKMGQNAGLVAMDADYDKRVVSVTTTDRTIRIPFERIDSLRPAVGSSEKKKPKKGE